ncbi:MAG: phosphoglucosamine mutase [Planctomycetota bacterium]|nr:MAG: phosphoglucosamine mutase [Planctomycetota bacterium]
MSEPLFGTDGMRARAGEEPLTPPTLARLGRILAERVRAGLPGATPAGAQRPGGRPPRVLLGHDGRESGETLAAALSRGLNQGGVDVEVLGLAPTPAIAYLTSAGPYAAGIVVSASHNPAADNGVKLLGPDGGKIPDALERELERELVGAAPYPRVTPAGSLRRNKRLLGDVLAWYRNSAFPRLDLRGWRVALDCGNGAYSQLGPRILRAFGAELRVLHDKPDGRNINDGCGALFPEEVARATREHGCVVGLTVDGDGDRGLLADGAGRVLDGDALLAGLGTHLLRHGRLPQRTVVATIMSNLALERHLAAAGGQLLRVPVGDRNVAAAMRAGGYRLGGEKSGHLLFGPEHGYRGDGMYNLLRVVAAVQEDGLAMERFGAGYRDLPQQLVNVPVTRRVPLEQLRRLQAAVAALERELNGAGRVVVRFSGTELRLRLMVEADSELQVRSALERLQQAAAADGILA